LYSGLGEAGAEVASAYAAESGAAVIGDTFAGAVLNLADTAGIPYALQQPLWDYFSGMFASGASQAMVFLGPTVSATSIYLTTELPALIENGIIPWVVWPQ
jgi:hypothetical protein